MKQTELSFVTGLQLDTSPVPGVVFRNFQGESDYPHILAVINGSKAADGVQRSDTLEDVTRNYAHLHNCDPYQDMLFAEVDAKVVGYCRAWWNITGDGNFIGFHLAFLLPEWRRKGIGTAFVRFCEDRMRRTARHMLECGNLNPDTPCFFDIFASETEKGKEALLLKESYNPIRYFFDMVRPDLENIPEAPLPEGLEVRPVLPDHYRLIWDASNEAFRDHWGYIPEPDEEFEKMLEAPNFDPSLWRVAWGGDQVAGMVLSFINDVENNEYGRKRGYTENICVRRPWRKRGLARGLIVQSLHAIKERGMQEAALGVDSENISGALRLYESCGFQTVKRNAAFRKPFDL